MWSTRSTEVFKYHQRAVEGLGVIWVLSIFAINTTSLMKGVVIFMKIKFRNVDTGEIIEIDGDDFESFDECMSHKNYQLIFD